MITVSDARAREPQLLSDLKALVEIESPSSDKSAVDHLAEFLAARLEHLGAYAQIHQIKNFGNHVQADFAGVSESKPVLLLGHIDTVWELGTLKQMPFRVADGRATCVRSAVARRGPHRGPRDVERRGQVLVIRMLREEKRNAVDRALADALDAGFNQLEDDPELWVGVLTGTPAVFSQRRLRTGVALGTLTA